MSADADMIFTDSAANKVRTLIEEEQNDNLKLRVFITGGGCAGFSYGFTFDESMAEDDTVVENAGVTMVVDPASYLGQESETIVFERQRSIAESEKNLVIGSSAPINLKKKPCDGCDCGRAKNITIDIEDIGK